MPLRKDKLSGFLTAFDRKKTRFGGGYVPLTHAKPEKGG